MLADFFYVASCGTKSAGDCGQSIIALAARNGLAVIFDYCFLFLGSLRLQPVQFFRRHRGRNHIDCDSILLAGYRMKAARTYALLIVDAQTEIVTVVLSDVPDRDRFWRL